MANSQKIRVLLYRQTAVRQLFDDLYDVRVGAQRAGKGWLWMDTGSGETKAKLGLNNIGTYFCVALLSPEHHR